jgi:transcriptional regulator with XRE-family HTH domain
MESGNSLDKHVGGRVRLRRTVLGLRPKYLANALDTTVQQIQQWEAGTSCIGSTQLLELANILGVNAAFFFADSDPNEPSGEIGLKETLSLPRKRYRKSSIPLRQQFSIIVERNGVELSRDTLSARDANEARAIFIHLTSAEFFDPLDETLRCRAEPLDT